MEWLSQATAFDIVVFLVFLAFLVRGLWIGFIQQISSLVAMVGGFILAGYFDEDFYRLIMPYLDNSHTTFLISYFLLFLLFFYLIKLVGLGLKKVMDITLMGWFDRTMGGLFGLIKGVFFTSLLFIMVASYMSGSNRYLKKSLSYPVMSKSSQALLALIQDKKLRSYFIPKEPAIQRLKRALPTLDDFKKPEAPAEKPDPPVKEPEESAESEEADSEQKEDKKGVLL
jgi:membrane protein required for colicin V production